ncbi:hypothetical protein BGW38_001576, partial [Lunasporangiospora selenospora]
MPRKKSSSGARGPASIAEGLNLANKEEAMGLILDRLQNLTDKGGRVIAELFMALPDRDIYPDYYGVIKNPIAFDVIEDKLERGDYSGSQIENFANDLRTLTTNAKIYNIEGSLIHKDAATLEKYIAAALKALIGDAAQRQRKEEISKPIAISEIQRKVDMGEYTTSESFEDDVNRMFDNAKQYNAEGSVVYMDALELQRLFYKETGRKMKGRPQKYNIMRQHIREFDKIDHRGETYNIGDFVHIRNLIEPSKPTVGLIFGIWEDEDARIWIDASWFQRPEHIVHPYTSRFYENEVVKTSGMHEHVMDEILDKCYVLYAKDYVRGRPKSWREGRAIYICEQRYHESEKSLSRIKNWPACLPPDYTGAGGNGTEDLDLFPTPLVIKKLPSVSMLDKIDKIEKRVSSKTTSSRASSPPEATFASANASRETSPGPKHGKRKSDLYTPDLPSTLSTRVPPGPTEQQQRFSQQAPPTIAPSTLALVDTQQFSCTIIPPKSKTRCTAVFPTELGLRNHIAVEHSSLNTNQPTITSPVPSRRRRRSKNETSAVLTSVTSPPLPPSSSAIPGVRNSIDSSGVALARQPGLGSQSVAGAPRFDYGSPTFQIQQIPLQGSAAGVSSPKPVQPMASNYIQQPMSAYQAQLPHQQGPAQHQPLQQPKQQGQPQQPSQSPFSQGQPTPVGGAQGPSQMGSSFGQPLNGPVSAVPQNQQFGQSPFPLPTPQQIMQQQQQQRPGYSPQQMPLLHQLPQQIMQQIPQQEQHRPQQSQPQQQPQAQSQQQLHPQQQQQQSFASNATQQGFSPQGFSSVAQTPQQLSQQLSQQLPQQVSQHLPQQNQHPTGAIAQSINQPYSMARTPQLQYASLNNLNPGATPQTPTGGH